MSPSEEKELQVLQEILKWIKFSGMKEVKAALESILDTPQKRLAYQLSDGEHTQEQVKTSAGIKGDQMISDLWKGWPRSGLGESVEIRKGAKRFKRSFDLDDFGIEYPRPQGQSLKTQAPLSSQAESTGNNAVETGVESASG